MELIQSKYTHSSTLKSHSIEMLAYISHNKEVWNNINAKCNIGEIFTKLHWNHNI